MNNKIESLLLNELFNTIPTFDNYIDFSNLNVVAALKNSNIQYIHLCGDNLSGKTHLLTAWTIYNGYRNSIIINIHNKQLLDNIDELVSNYQFIAIDNIEIFNEELQIKVFDLFNKIKLNKLSNHRLLTSSKEILLKYTNLIRIDLLTRLSSGIVFNLKPISNAELIVAVQKYLKDKQIVIQDRELNYLFNHYTRSFSNIIQTIDYLATQATSKKRSITIQFIKEHLNNQ